MEISPLDPEYRKALDDGLAMAARIAGQPAPLSSADVQGLYDAFRTEGIETAEAIIALGLAFGALIEREAGYEWVRVEDEYGKETCLAPVGMSVTIAPISMIQKRLAEGVEIDIAELVAETIRSVQKLLASGEYQAR